MTDKKQTKPARGKDHVAEHHKDLADRIIAQIKTGSAPWQKPWDPGKLVRPLNLFTRRTRLSQGREVVSQGRGAGKR